MATALGRPPARGSSSCSDTSTARARPYRIVTWTALRDGATWDAVPTGSIAAAATCDGPAHHLDDLRHGGRTAKLLLPLPWSPLQEVDLAQGPTGPVEHEPTLFMEDTVHPNERHLEEYVVRLGSHYAREMQEHDAHGQAMLRVEASFRTAVGKRPTPRGVALAARVIEPRGLLALMTREIPEAYERPGTWMHDALERDQWRSRLLRTWAVPLA